MTRFILVGREEIAQAIGESPRRIPYLVKEQGLPAKRETTDGSAPWKAHPEALQEWCRQRYLAQQQKADALSSEN